MMKGRVVVQPAGTPYPKTQDQIDLETAKLLAADVEAALKATLKGANVSTSPGSNGTIIHKIKLGYGNGSIALMRFIPTDLTILLAIRLSGFEEMWRHHIRSHSFQEAKNQNLSW